MVRIRELYAHLLMTYIDRICLSLMEGVHMTIWEKSIGEQRKENKFWKSKKFIS